MGMQSFATSPAIFQRPAQQIEGVEAVTQICLADVARHWCNIVLSIGTMSCQGYHLHYITQHCVSIIVHLQNSVTFLDDVTMLSGDLPYIFMA